MSEIRVKAIGHRPSAISLTALMFVVVMPISAQQPMTLQQAIEIAQRQGTQARVVLDTREAARWRDRAFNARLMPQLSLTGTLPNYLNSIDPVVQPDGSTKFVPRRQTESALGMTVRQPLPFTGGELLVSSGLSRVDVGGLASSRVYNSTPVTIGVAQDLFRSNSLKWDSREQDLRAVVADREYLEAREDVAVNTATAFFDLFSARLALDNAAAKVSINDTLFNLNKGRFEVGKIGENDLLQSELALLQARTSLDGAKLDFDRANAAIKRLLSLPPNAPIDIVAPTDIPITEVDTALAVEQALRNQSRTIGTELQGVQAKRRVTEARLNNGFNARVTATVGFNQRASVFDAAYQDLAQKQQYGVNVSVPIVQWGNRKAQVEAAQADRDRANTNARATRDQAAEEAHFAALQLAQSARNLTLSAKADTVAVKRFEVAKNRYIVGKIGIDNLYLAQNERDGALRGYIDALRGYWASYYRLRRLTLYDFAERRTIR
ncbi:MAG TPA: TolC family protein [Gemmatimonadaceae bacterium]|nr:TolC family protein [Gemmatimonadaceae bacterium]